MAYLILRIIYGAWAAGAIAFMLNSVSALLFSRKRLSKKLIGVVTTTVFCVLWPLSLFSAAGRKVLLGKFNQL